MADNRMPIPRELVQRKPPHGAPCTRCGICCIATLCDLAMHIHQRFPTDNGGFARGPCPSLRFDENHNSVCGLATDGTKELNEAAKFIIGSGYGCDARINGEPKNEAFNKRLDQWDQDHAAEVIAAKRLWGMLG